MKNARTLGAWFVIANLCAAGALGAEPLFRDTFHNRLQPGWSWIREDASAWRVKNGALEIRIQPGNMWGPENSGKNVLVRELPPLKEGAIEISTTVEHSPTEQYEQADLVAYWDDSHMVKIGEELVDGKLSIVMGREEKDRTRTINIIPLSVNKVELKLRIEQGRVTGSYRPKGEGEWHTAGTCDWPGTVLPRIALQTYQGTNQKEHWARITNFQITSP